MTNHYRMEVDAIEIPLSGPSPCSVVFTGFTSPGQANAFFSFVHDEVFRKYNLAKEFNEYLRTKDLKSISLSSSKSMYDGTILVGEVEVITKDENEKTSNN